MRSEAEMLDLIVNYATESKRIRVVEMNGSRVGAKLKADSFQDYDIVYYVEDMEPFLEDHSWVDGFGERVMMQMPDQMGILPTGNRRQSYSYLMLFTDGNRIDLTLTPLKLLEESLKTIEPRKILIDKDNRIQPLIPSTENPYVNEDGAPKYIGSFASYKFSVKGFIF